MFSNRPHSCQNDVNPITLLSCLKPCKVFPMHLEGNALSPTASPHDAVLLNPGHTHPLPHLLFSPLASVPFCEGIKLIPPPLSKLMAQPE